MPEIPVPPQIPRPEAPIKPQSLDTRPPTNASADSEQLAPLLRQLSGQLAQGDSSRGVLKTLADNPISPPELVSSDMPITVQFAPDSDVVAAANEDGVTSKKPPEASSDLDHNAEKVSDRLGRQIKESLVRLKPEVITTDDGVSRTVYTFMQGDVPMRVIFYPPNELPVSEEYFKGKRLHLIGDKPGWRTDDDWNSYITQLQKLDSDQVRLPGEDMINPTNFYSGEVGNRPGKQTETLMLIEQSPRALVDLAIATGTENNPHLLEMRKLLIDRKTNAEIDDAIDAIIASKILDGNGEYQHLDASDTSAEALTVLALTGDKEAQAKLKTKRDQLAEHDRKHNIVDPNQPLELHPEDRATLNRLSAIHVTRYLPVDSADGGYWEVPTTFDATNIRHPRITWHTTFQERTGENAMAMGSAKFAGTPYALVTRVRSLIEHNGAPHSSSPEDSFYEISPGRRVRIPKEDAVLVRPGNPTGQSELFKTDDSRHEVVYKHAGFKPEDIAQIYEAGRSYDDQAIKNAIFASMRRSAPDYKFEISDDDARALAERMGGAMHLNGDVPNVNFQYNHNIPNPPNVLEELKVFPIDVVIEKYFPSDQFSGPKGDALRARFTSAIEGIVASKVKDLAMDHIVEGFRDGIDLGQDFEGNQRALDRLGVKNLGGKGHDNHNLMSSERAIGSILDRIRQGDIDQKTHHSGGVRGIENGDPIVYGRPLITDQSPAVRKLYYYEGLI